MRFYASALFVFIKDKINNLTIENNEIKTFLY